jgi:glycosyltransferase involved in cell wall biosynthesis
MPKILFIIESLHSGGKERRLVEFIKYLHNNSSFTIDLILTDRTIHYTEVLNIDISIHYLKRTIIKNNPLQFVNTYVLIKSISPDIIHAWGNMVSLLAIPAKILLKIPLVNSQITDAPLKNGSFITKARNFIAFLLSNRILANSRAGINAYMPPINKSRVIYNGFDFKRIARLEEHHTKTEISIISKYVICMVASFNQTKDYSTFIRAASIILGDRQDITFLCIGGGDYAPYKLLVPDKYYEYIKFLPAQKKIENIMSIVDIGVLATKSEGIPNVLIEFMALGKPIVATACGGIPELVKSGSTGFLIPVGEYNKLAAHLVELVDNDDMRRRIGQNARKSIEDEFTIAGMSERIIQEYRSLILAK